MIALLQTLKIRTILIINGRSEWRDTFLNDAISRQRLVFLVFWVEKSRRRSLSADPFNHQKSSRYSSLVAVGLWLSFIGLNWTSFSWYAARINSLALSSCLALKYLCKYRVCLKYLDLSLLALRVDFRSLKYSRYQFMYYHKRSRTLRSRKHSIMFHTSSSETFTLFVSFVKPYASNIYVLPSRAAVSCKTNRIKCSFLRIFMYLWGLQIVRHNRGSDGNSKSPHMWLSWRVMRA